MVVHYPCCLIEVRRHQPGSERRTTYVSNIDTPPRSRAAAVRQLPIAYRLQIPGPHLLPRQLRVWSRLESHAVVGRPDYLAPRGTYLQHQRYSQSRSHCPGHNFHQIQTLRGLQQTLRIAVNRSGSRSPAAMDGASRMLASRSLAS